MNGTVNTTNATFVIIPNKAVALDVIVFGISFKYSIAFFNCFNGNVVLCR